ncbi:hypothetical protein EJ05DRAFT_343347 [Pseudovirgaria hyperparasitica]|uniref:Uncharacterized protein n=1 Tax=Pseudovirgaria hyperparasitica TaxID=470096 RepID=A0A6A6WBK9_9PEZI|nr:uncharacterized protein EJ05DRAFT_343347 [Pseudovirgaria hyperparasitica]KAF2759350.1 hypothetical protein EJ05DRAFT_343347 [Pseudovirgaria hyperparasitica]
MITSSNVLSSDVAQMEEINQDATCIPGSPFDPQTVTTVPSAAARTPARKRKMSNVEERTDVKRSGSSSQSDAMPAFILQVQQEYTSWLKTNEDIKLQLSKQSKELDKIKDARLQDSQELLRLRPYESKFVAVKAELTQTRQLHESDLSRDSQIIDTLTLKFNHCATEKEALRRTLDTEREKNVKKRKNLEHEVARAKHQRDVWEADKENFKDELSVTFTALSRVREAFQAHVGIDEAFRSMHTAHDFVVNRRPEENLSELEHSGMGILLSGSRTNSRVMQKQVSHVPNLSRSI